MHMWKKIKQKDYAEEIKRTQGGYKNSQPQNKQRHTSKKKSMVINKDTTKSDSKSYMAQVKKIIKVKAVELYN